MLNGSWEISASHGSNHVLNCCENVDHWNGSWLPPQARMHRLYIMPVARETFTGYPWLSVLPTSTLTPKVPFHKLARQTSKFVPATMAIRKARATQAMNLTNLWGDSMLPLVSMWSPSSKSTHSSMGIWQAWYVWRASDWEATPLFIRLRKHLERYPSNSFSGAMVRRMPKPTVHFTSKLQSRPVLNEITCGVWASFSQSLKLNGLVWIIQMPYKWCNKIFQKKKVATSYPMR